MKWYQRVFRYPEVWFLTGIALFSRLWKLDLPHSIVFDEVYFRQFAANYVDGHYFFDIHPPIVKLALAGIGSMFHLSAQQIAAGDPGALLLRFLPALAGVALVPLVYAVIRQFGLGRRVATIGALLILFDNALLVESRFVLTDSILLLSGMGALSCFLQLRKTTGIKHWVWLVLSAILLGVSVSTKWTALAIAALLFVTWLIDGMMRKTAWHRMVAEGFLTVVIVAAIYIGSFAIHFALLKHSGEGDAFMSDKFQSTLVGNPKYNKDARMSLWDKMVELNTVMYTSQKGISTHPYASRWYSWPLELRTVYYWQGKKLPDNTQGNIYLLGNPVVWWTSAACVLSALLVWIVRPEYFGRRRKLMTFLLAGYAVNFVPFMLINRPMFLYHYLFALIFAILITAVMIWLLFEWQAEKYSRTSVKLTSWAIAITIFLGYIYFLPLSYGWPITASDLDQHLWLPSWR